MAIIKELKYLRGLENKELYMLVDVMYPGYDGQLHLFYKSEKVPVGMIEEETTGNIFIWSESRNNYICVLEEVGKVKAGKANSNIDSIWDGGE